MTKIHCLALHVACVCMESIYDPILGQRFVFTGRGKTDEIDERLILRHSSHPWGEKRNQHHHVRQRAYAQKVYTKQKIKSYNRTQKK